VRPGGRFMFRFLGIVLFLALFAGTRAIAQEETKHRFKETPSKPKESIESVDSLKVKVNFGGCTIRTSSETLEFGCIKYSVEAKGKDALKRASKTLSELHELAERKEKEQQKLIATAMQRFAERTAASGSCANGCNCSPNRSVPTRCSGCTDNCSCHCRSAEAWPRSIRYWQQPMVVYVPQPPPPHAYYPSAYGSTYTDEQRTAEIFRSTNERIMGARYRQAYGDGGMYAGQPGYSR